MLSRRQLLRRASAVALTATVWPLRRADASASDDGLLRLARSRASWVTVGAAYLAEHPEERDAERLTEALRAAGLASADADLHARFRQRCRADFAAGDVVAVDGWVLSRSEVRLAVLAALDAAP